MSRVVADAAMLRRLVFESLFRRGIYGPRLQEGIVDQFHRLYYDSSLFEGTWMKTSWLGVPTRKCPLDLWVYQEILHEVRPEVIVECGTAYGGSALYFASICDLLGRGSVVTIDVEAREGRREHPRIAYLIGSSTSEEIVREVERRLGGADGGADGGAIMVVLDSDHRKEHVLAELEIYSRFVTNGSYLVVEDTNVNGHPVEPGFGPGPMEAVEEFLAGRDDFEVDRQREKFYLTFNPRGFLRKVR